MKKLHLLPVGLVSFVLLTGCSVNPQEPSDSNLGNETEIQESSPSSEEYIVNNLGATSSYHVMQKQFRDNQDTLGLEIKVYDNNFDYVSGQTFEDLGLGLASSYAISPNEKYIAITVDNVGSGCSDAECEAAFRKAQEKVQEQGGVWLYNVGDDTFSQVGNSWGNEYGNYYHQIKWTTDNVLEYSLDAPDAVQGTFQYNPRTKETTLNQP